MTDEQMTKEEAVDAILIAQLAACRTHQEAAKAAKVSTKFVQRRLADPDFAAEAARGRAVNVNALTAKTTASGDRALETILELLESPEPTVRLRAADLLLNWGTRLRRESDFESRLAQLESRADGDDWTAEEPS